MLRDVDQLLDRRVRRVAPRRLGDVHRQVADALEIGVDLHGRDDGAEVGRHRLIERQQREAAVVDLDVERVQRLVAAHHAVDDAVVAVHEALDREADVLLGQAAHLEQPGLALFELLLKVRNDALFDRLHLAEPPRDVVLGQLLGRRGEDLVRPVALDQLAQPEESR